MEKKQLNFSAPLLSARRYSSPLRPSGEDKKRESPQEGTRTMIPTERSEPNLSEVVKPGSVPFMWEQIPGKAKSSSESQVQSPEDFPSTPKLPPAYLSRKSGELSVLRTPNKLSGELVVLKPRNKLSGELNILRQNKFSGELHTLRPQKFSGELNAFRSQNKLSGELGILNRFPSSNNNITEMNPSSESEDEDANTFSDAHETFSQLESSSFNCSMGGLSGLEPPEPKHMVNGSSVEPRARDFMMDRFLPAAKAMTLEPSQYASRKQLVVVEQPKEVKALIPRAKTPPPSRNVCNNVPYTGQYIGAEESQDDEEGEGAYDEQSAISIKIKACGFLPWFCSKNSIRLLNPLPSMKNRSKSVLSSASKVGNLVKNRSWKSSSPKVAKHVPCSNQKHKVEPVFKSCELQKPKLTSRPMFYSGELQTTRIGSPYRNSNRRNSPSAYRNESPHNLYHKGVGFLAVPNRVNPYDENRMKSGRKDSKRFEQLRKSTTLEETMYIDSVNIAKVSHSIMNLPKTRKQVDASGNDLEGLTKSGRLEIMRARGMSGPLVQRPNFSEGSKMATNGNRNTCRELVVIGDDRGGGARSPFTPPLPKSPSESWLSRNLPSISPRNSVSYSSLNSKLQSRKHNANGSPISGAKWETIVKSSHLHHDLGRYSEELVTLAPQRPQSRSRK